VNSSRIERDFADYTGKPFEARSVRAFSLKIFFRSSGAREWGILFYCSIPGALPAVLIS
jgi:hypothetical protein